MWTREKWINDWYKKFPGSSEEVLGFIYDVVSKNRSPQEAEVIERLFGNGYCYYFALMLKDAFGGEIRWVKYHSHIVWEDTSTNVCYDIHGVYYDYGEFDILPIEVLGEEVETFKHRGKDYDKSIITIQKETQKRVNEYEKEMGWPVTKDPYCDEYTEKSETPIEYKSTYSETMKLRQKQITNFFD